MSEAMVSVWAPSPGERHYEEVGIDINGVTTFFDPQGARNVAEQLEACADIAEGLAEA